MKIQKMFLANHTNGNKLDNQTVVGFYEDEYKAVILVVRENTAVETLKNRIAQKILDYLNKK